MYALVGSKVPPGLVEELRPDYGKRNKRLIDHGWAPDGKLWFAVKLSEPMIRGGVLGVPGGLKSYLQGDWRLVDQSGREIHTLRIKETTVWRVGPPLRRIGAEPDDVAAFVFDLPHQSVRLHLGGHEIVERLRDTTEIDQLVIDDDEFNYDNIEME